MLQRFSPNVLVAIGLTLGLAGTASAQTPAGPVWWPSEWGPEDERGAANRITPAKILEAVSLIEEGRIYELGRGYEAGMPLFGNRHFSLTIPGCKTPPSRCFGL